MGQDLVYTHLRQILPGLHSPAVIELGAHIGTDTVKLLALLDNPVYLAVEPDPRNVLALDRLKRERGLDFTIAAVAVAAKTERRELYLSDGVTWQGRRYTDGSSLLKPAALALATGFTWPRSVTIEAISLDDLCREYRLDRVDFIWADVQGAELELIAGGKHALANTRYLYTEYRKDLYHGSPGQAEILTALGQSWQVMMDDGVNVLVRNGRYP